MARVARDATPQRRLVDLLRVEVDRSCKTGKPTRKLDAIVRDNPNSIWSTHVTYNIGRKRTEWLRAQYSCEGVSHARGPFAKSLRGSFVRSSDPG